MCHLSEAKMWLYIATATQQSPSIQMLSLSFSSLHSSGRFWTTDSSVSTSWVVGFQMWAWLLATSSSVHTRCVDFLLPGLLPQVYNMILVGWNGPSPSRQLEIKASIGRLSLPSVSFIWKEPLSSRVSGQTSPPAPRKAGKWVHACYS